METLPRTGIRVNFGIYFRKGEEQKTMKKKALSLFLVAAMAASMAGCGSKDTNTAATDNGTADSAASTEAGSASSDEEAWSGTLTVWSPQEDQDSGWLKEQCDAFNEAHPNWDITFEYGVCAEGDAKTTISTDVESAADVYMLANDNIPDLVSANALSELGGTYLDQVKSTNSDTIVTSVTYKDSVYAFPFTSNTWFMYYDKSVFTDDDIKSFDTMLSKGKVSFPLSNSWYIQAFNDQDGAGIAGLRDGSVNAIFSGSWDAASVKEALGDNYGVAALPTFTVDGNECQMKSFAGSKAIGVNPNCENPQVAMSLAAYLSGEEAQQAHYDERNILPSNTNITLADDPIATATADVLDHCSIMQPIVSAMGNYWSPAENMGKNLIAGDVTHDNAAEKTEDMNTAMNTDVAADAEEATE